MNDIESLRIDVGDKLERLIEVIQSSGKLACALVYRSDKFENILTDGDIRRAILNQKSLDLNVDDVLKIKRLQSRPNPIYAIDGAELREIRALFQKNNLRQLLIVSKNGNPVDVINYNDIDYLPQHLDQKFSVLIMAGGFGTRLRPLTDITPKPMLEVNGLPMLEIIILRLKQFNVSKIYISVHYLRDKIVEYFGDGEKFGVIIEYLHEDIPMGTGGCLRLIQNLRSDLLIINGDVLSQLDFEMFHGYHIHSRSNITVAASQYNFVVPYGVIQEEGLQVRSFIEKPSYSFLVNSGIYFISPKVMENLPFPAFFNMTDVIQIQINLGGGVNCFPIFEKWLDIGQPSDYALAENFFKGPAQ